MKNYYWKNNNKVFGRRALENNVPHIVGRKKRGALEGATTRRRGRKKRGKNCPTTRRRKENRKRGPRKRRRRNNFVVGVSKDVNG